MRDPLRMVRKMENLLFMFLTMELGTRGPMSMVFVRALEQYSTMEAKWLTKDSTKKDFRMEKGQCFKMANRLKQLGLMELTQGLFLKIKNDREYYYSSSECKFFFLGLSCLRNILILNIDNGFCYLITCF